MSVNVIVASGRLGRDPELKTTNGGTSVTNFSIAVDSGYGDKKVTMWLNVICFGKLAETMNQHLKKGREVVVTGRLQVREYESQGATKKAVEIVASSVDFVGGKPEESGPVTQTNRPPKTNPQNRPPANRAPQDDESEEPF